MNSKIRNSIIQKFSMVGYQCLENTRQTLWLVNSKRNLEIRYDMRKYPCIYGKISHIRELRCNIIIRYGYHSVECFSMRDFKALHIEDEVLVYNDQEHFEQAILEFTERLLTDGIPILDELVSSLVYVEENFYERLSQEPEKQAKEFAICHSLEMNGTLDNQVLAEEWLRQQKKSNDGASLFIDRIDEFIGFAAYAGELLLAKYQSGCWAWWPQSPGEEIRTFGLFFPEEDDGYDILSAMIRFWNFADYFHSDGLFLESI